MIKNFSDIIKRANKLGINRHEDNISLIMDIDCANDNTEIDSDLLLGFDDLNFTHDIVGIQNNINRQTSRINNCFVPRSACR